MADMTDHHAISSLIANMHWGVRAVDEGRQLLTSDRPVRLEFPLRSEKSFLTLPIAPRLLFLAAKSLRGLNRLLNSDLRVLVERNNRKVVRQARQLLLLRTTASGTGYRNISQKSRSPVFLTSFAALA
ncbi:hypothetical protein ACDY96_24905 [Rhizobium mongolense]|uniref:hypothetical protein n=1 Tax=Rhizobium mongolense TaxID=57676 RepID=UPI00355603A5